MINPNPKHVIASDTDSLYFVMTPLLEKLYPNMDLEDPKNRKFKIDTLLKITDHLQTEANNNLQNLASDLFNINKNHQFELKQEVLAEKAYWSGKRRYAMYIVNKEGVEVEELEMKGLDLMKSNFPPIFREFGEKTIKDILFSAPKETINKNVLDFRTSLGKMDWRKLLKPTGLKKLDEYIEEKPSNGEIFTKFKKRCPINTRAAAYSNDLLKHLKTDQIYPEFTIGMKMYYAQLKKNPYRIDVIALNGYDDHPEIVKFVEKYIDREGTFDSVFKNKLHNLYEDIGWELVLNPHINKFFV